MKFQIRLFPPKKKIFGISITLFRRDTPKMCIKTAWMETRPILSIGPICVFMRVFRGSRMPCEPGGFSFELESAVQARHGHSKAKEDEDKRLWKKAWGFNLFPVFISPPGDKPCAIKNISYSHCLAAWPHL